MTDRRYEVVMVKPCDCGISTCEEEPRDYLLDSIPDDLAEEAGARISEALMSDGGWADVAPHLDVVLARAALGVLFPEDD